MLKKIFRVVMVVVCIIGFIGLGGCESTERQHQFGRDRIKEITEIEVQIESKILFHYIDNSFVNGRAEQLTVFEFDTEPTAWLEENKFLRGDDETLVDDKGYSLVNKNIGHFLSYFKNETKNGEKVPKEYVPSFKIPYFWIRTQNVYFFYYPETLMLIVYVAWS